MKFDLIYADPPWEFKSNSQEAPGRNVQKHYKTMSIKELKMMPIGSLAEENSMLTMWVTGPTLDQGISLLRSWGFKYKGTIFVWVKTTKKGTLHKGLGYTTRKNAEICIYGTKGKGLGIPINRNIEEVIIAQRQKHSQKPTEAYERLELLYPTATRLELFARNLRNQWISFGNELPEGYATGKKTLRGIANLKVKREYFHISTPVVEGFY